ncbi:MAG: hypothetical protein NTW59_02630 [Candidatus Diapherotrites archaeon]|nr:hypothetical protein [Candidatus Diapherotrites archaeon]
MVGEQEFLLAQFRRYYEKHAVSEPPDISAREFGVGAFGQKIVKRHLSFNSSADFNSFLRKETPLFVSYSSALYKYPDKRPMDAKEMVCADLVYEFDADDLPCDCRQQHDSWRCPACNADGKGRQLKCDKCGSTTQVSEWFCEKCLGVAKEKVSVLLDFLRSDFGFEEGVVVNFSGRAGYHVHVRSKDVRALPAGARIELIDYLTANNLNIFSHFKKEGSLLQGTPLPQARGWQLRILSEVTALLQGGDAERIAVFGNITSSQAKKMLAEKEIILKAIKEKGVLPSVLGRASAHKESQSDRFWGSFIKSVIERIAPIDRQTSTDINKIVRVPETLHGETGLVAAKVPIEGLKGFDPLRDAVAFPAGETVNVLIDKAPSFYLGETKFGPFSGERAELPLHAAVFLLGRGAATLAEGALK